MRTGLPKKVIFKSNKDLMDLHQRCITTYLTQRGCKHRTIKKFHKLYEIYISPKNIRNYFHRPIELFVKALVQDRLGEISDYI